MIRVIVTGAAGRMGHETVKAVTSAGDMEIVAVVDPATPDGGRLDGDAAPVNAGDLATAIEDSHPDVLVDFTVPQAVIENVRVAALAGVDCVVGTTGIDPALFREILDDTPEGTSVFVAPNFAIGAVLLMRFAEEAARHLPHAEVIELHHDKKADAPSGTAMRTASLIAGARASTPDVPGRESESVPGARGADVDGVPVHSVRLPGLVAHQEVIFGGRGQTLSLRHDSIDRTSFMPGVLLAIRASSGLSGLTVGLENLLGDD